MATNEFEYYVIHKLTAEQVGVITSGDAPRNADGLTERQVSRIHITEQSARIRGNVETARQVKEEFPHCFPGPFCDGEAAKIFRDEIAMRAIRKLQQMGYSADQVCDALNEMRKVVSDEADELEMDGGMVLDIPAGS